MVLENIKSLILSGVAGLTTNIIAREDTVPFWKECIKVVDAGNGYKTPNRVCAVGSPGIGRTSTTPILIKLLLSKEGPITVVYIKYTSDVAAKKTGWYCVFTKNADGEFSTSLFPEDTRIVDIKEVFDDKTYFVIDPGPTKLSANPSEDVLAKVIINASPDRNHWGGSAFTKGGKGTGVHCYYPLWTLDELVAAARYIEHPFEGNSEEYRKLVSKSFRLFGGLSATKRICKWNFV
jgi:hypothetical protein